MAKAPHHAGRYHVDAQRVRSAARANPDQRCWRCGRPLDEHPTHHNGTPPRWTAGHTRTGQPHVRLWLRPEQPPADWLDAAPALAPEASTCNYADGGAATPRTRATGYDWP